MSGLFCCQEATYETDTMATGDQENEILGSVWRLARKTADTGRSGENSGG